MADIQCPICGKNGIPDYHAQDTVCPCCGSDLSVYRIVDGLKDSIVSVPAGRPRRIESISYSLAAVFAVIAIVACIAIARSHSTIAQNEARIAALETDNVILSKQNQELAASVSTLEANQTQSKGFAYTVRSGDSFWKISQKVYGTGMRYKELAEKNGLSTNHQLHVGDQLMVY